VFLIDKHNKSSAIRPMMLSRTSNTARHAVQMQQTRGFAENLKAIQMRIVSTANIQKITKSMKMVSAAKLKGDQARLANGKVFGTAMDKLFDYTAKEEEKPIAAFTTPLYVAITSDRGLCGGVNSSITRTLRRVLDSDSADGLSPKAFIVGDKGHGPLVRLHSHFLCGQVNEPWKNPMNFAKTQYIADRIIESAADSDCIKILYNKFYSAIRYETETITIPNYPKLAAVEDENNNDLPLPLNRYEGELESTEEFLLNMFDYGVSVRLYGCLIDNATSEQSSRMQAMENASKNAQEMVDKLTIKYNRARQAKITTELIEIISGAESLKG